MAAREGLDGAFDLAAYSLLNVRQFVDPRELSCVKVSPDWMTAAVAVLAVARGDVG